jgi:L-rhamnose 1-dehydrogenase
MAKLLQGKTAAITGAVTGIGRAIALEYLRQGASVAVNHFPDDKSSTQFQELRKSAGEDGDRLIAVAGDISKPESGQELVQQTVESFGGRLDIFVSNAGVCQFADFLTCVCVPTVLARPTR